MNDMELIKECMESCKEESGTAHRDFVFETKGTLDRILTKLDKVKETDYIFAHIEEKYAD
jgi:hypothetical protein|tara:strand:- start:1346 stop:1525 length:180 start_codon:yes stop_codon:yes gene_type:complete